MCPAGRQSAASPIPKPVVPPPQETMGFIKQFLDSMPSDIQFVVEDTTGGSEAVGVIWCVADLQRGGESPPPFLSLPLRFSQLPRPLPFRPVPDAPGGHH